MLNKDRQLIDDYIARHGVNKIPEGEYTYKKRAAPRTKKARLLIERHEQTQ